MKINILSNSTKLPYSPLRKYGYLLESALNNENRWYTKVVCSILDKDFKPYVSTTYTEYNDYLRLVENITFLNCNNKLSPKIINVYSQEKAVICEYVGEFLSDHLIDNPLDTILILSSIFDYFKDINSINQSYKRFVIPLIVKTAIQLTDVFDKDFEFLPKCKGALSNLESSEVKFSYGYGIEDSHIWNFRIVRTKDKIQALTTDFDYFSDKVNCFWELGYFYATLRWFKKNNFSLARKSEEILLSLMQDNGDLKSEFMFWLGVLSSYCGYKDSLINLMMSSGIDKLREEHQLIRQLDEKVFCLASKLLFDQEYIEHNVLDEAFINLEKKEMSTPSKILALVNQ